MNSNTAYQINIHLNYVYDFVNDKAFLNIPIGYIILKSYWNKIIFTCDRFHTSSKKITGIVY